MISRKINWFDRSAILCCDGNCSKAWGINSRPEIQLSDDPDDFVYFSDDELGIAPEDPGTAEGPHSKPRHEGERLNKWCARECERSRIVPEAEFSDDLELPDFSKRDYNMPWLHPEAALNGEVTGSNPIDVEFAINFHEFQPKE